MKRLKLSPSRLPMLKQCGRFESASGTSAAAQDGLDQHDELEALIKADGKAEAVVTKGVGWAYQFIKQICGDAHVEAERTAIVDHDDYYYSVRFDADADEFVFDYKSGSFRDYAGQMACAAIAIFQENPLIDSVTSFELYGRDEFAHRRSWTRESATELVESIYQNVVDMNEATCEYCSWCGRRNECESFLAEVEAGQTSAKVDVIKSFDDLAKPEDLARLYDIAKTVEQWSKDATAYVKKKILTEGFDGSEHFRTQSGRKSETIADTAEAFKRSGLTVDEYVSASKITVKAIAEVIATHQGIDAKDAAERVRADLGDLVENKVGASFIVRKRGSK